MANNSPCLIVDFDDSFTYNIYSQLYQIGVKSEIVSHRESGLLRQDLSETLLILGPGPGHVTEYEGWVQKIQQRPKEQFLLGICLGHQILAKSLGLTLTRLPKPIHGEPVELTLPDWSDVFDGPFWGSRQWVQRYHSWSVDYSKRPELDWWREDGQVWGLRQGKKLGFQFHPESLGTGDPAIFFQCVKKVYL